MADSPDHESGSAARDAGSPDSPFAWSRLFGSRTPHEALEQLGGWLAPWVGELTLTSAGGDERRVAAWADEAAPGPADRQRHYDAVVHGDPDWKLSARSVAGDRWVDAALERAALALEAWRHARRALTRADGRLAARSRELDLLQSLGRRAAEARTPADLFTWTVSVLQQVHDLDLVLGAYPLGGSPEMISFLARPFSIEYLGELQARAARFLGWSCGDWLELQRVELDSYDAARTSRHLVREEDLVLLPLMRRGQPIACLLVVPSGEFSEADLRVLYSSSNQLSLHLDRILTVREAEADRFRSVVDSMPQGVVLADTRLRVVQTNRAAREMFAARELPARGELGETLTRLGLASPVSTVLEGQAPVAEGEAVFEDGSVWTATVSPLRDERGRPGGLVLVLSDVSERRRLQQQLAQSEKMWSLGQMISGVAHELNNPLASILGYSQMIQGATRDEKLARRVETLHREAERCRKIVENLLSFARQREPERKPLSLNQVVETTLSLLAYQMRVDDVRIERDLDPQLPALEGDSHQLEQMLVNLLTNARQAFRESDRPGGIHISTRVAGEEGVVLEVCDDGPGIPEALRSKIFDPFFTTKSPGQGTGLGLALVYNIVAAHGGAIEVRPRRERGTRFLITLPSGRPASESRPAPVAESAPTAFRTGRILVVDDEESVARMICDALSGEGHVTQSACDGRQALERLAQKEFDLVISDVRMPGMSGERLHEELCRTRPGLSRRLLLTTGDTFGTETERISERTGLEVLSKPFDLADLRSRVRARLAGPGDSRNDS